MVDDSAVFAVMVNESLALKAKYAVPRQSVIVDQRGSLVEEDFFANDRWVAVGLILQILNAFFYSTMNKLVVECCRSVIVVTRSGYIKRVPLDAFEAQSRGGKGKSGAKLSSDDTVLHLLTCHDHDSIVFVTKG
jgi:DNA gyrase subunit A